MKSLDTLKNLFRDLARPNFFEVEIVNNSGQSLEIVNTLVKSTTFPVYEVGKIKITRMGFNVDLPGDSIYGDFSITFHNDIDSKVRNYIKAWMDSINVSGNNQVIKSFAGIKNSKVLVRQLDNNFKQTKQYDFRFIWPNKIGEIALSHETENATEEFAVDFSYSSYTET